MADSDLIDFDSKPTDEPYDVVGYMRSLADRVMSMAEERERIDKEKALDPNWEWQPIHICPKHLAEIVLDDKTSPDIKYAILRATYAGHQWVWVGDGPEPIYSISFEAMG